MQDADRLMEGRRINIKERKRDYSPRFLNEIVRYLNLSASLGKLTQM